MPEQFTTGAKLVRRSSGAIVEMLPTGEKDEKGREYYQGLEEEEFVQLDAAGNEVIVRGFPKKPLAENSISPEYQAQLARERAEQASQIDEKTKPRSQPFEATAVEKEPLSETEEEVAELAIEVSTGIEDPSELDGNARMFGPAELRAMREASRRLTGLESPKVNPDDALLDPNIPNIVEKDTRPDVYTYLKDALPVVTRGDTEASRKYYDKFVTEENKQVSLDFLQEAVKADREIARVLDEAGLKPIDMAAVDAIRENPDVRYGVAKRLVQKLDMLVDRNPEDFGIRIAHDSAGNLKVDPQTGKRMKSRLYAVDMALKMLGGEFSERYESNDFARDSNDRVTIGQHRHAARAVIMSRFA
ncbi:MAG: hypothetical protein EOT05_02465 [Candidatus Microsaccharimonas sossegonensis]|uniref:Uncharacterized protein n=1 Tax=Candidatus Microsaccharimonas sossegonensis TaxID=2506948 RepID=A0A4Q0AHU3_9BACT|nr:MAG: hypothetical protein EOT05_02465 [Candidatus Microsaccharimonas sossegonensis]